MPDAHRPHLLYVAWGFPPSRSGGVYRALATANAFALAGWDVTVLTVDADALDRYTGIDASLEGRIEAGVRVVRLPFSWPQRDTNIRRFSRLRAYAPAAWQQLDRRRDAMAFPESTYGRWRSTLERAAQRVHREAPVDLVVASASPNVDFMAAWTLHRRYQVPYVMDYRDAWLLDVFSGRLLHPDGGRAARLERQLVEHARELWFVNAPIRDWHAARYPTAAARMHVVANGFDPELVPPPRARTGNGKRPLTFGYLGTLTRRVPLGELVAGWRWARENDDLAAHGQVRMHGYLGHYATPDAALRELIDSAADADLQYAGPVAKGEVAAEYASFDVLLLVIGAGRYVTSGKVFEYMATGLPIVSVHDPGNAASDVLRGYPLWFPVADLTAAAVGKALVRAAHATQAADDATRAAALAYASAFARDLQVRPRVDALGAGVSPAVAPGRRTTTASSADRAGGAPPIAVPAVERRHRAHAGSAPAPGSPYRVVALAAGPPMSVERLAELVRTLREAGGGDLVLELWSWAPLVPADPQDPASAHPLTARVLRPSTDTSIPDDPAAAPGVTGRSEAPAAGVTSQHSRGIAGLPRLLAAATRRVRRSRPAHAARAIVRGGLDRRFAKQALRDGDLLAAAGRADVVVALDPAAALAAWQIARRVSRPDVVLGLQAAERALRTLGAGPGSDPRPIGRPPIRS